MNQTIIICDDESKQAEQTKQILQEYFNSIGKSIRLQTYLSGEELLHDIKCGRVKANLIFMDIELEEMNGIDVAEQINQLIPACYIVYLTSHLEYAVEVYNSEHLYYILKEELEKRLPKLCEKLERIVAQEERNVSISMKNSGTMVVPADDIIYAERQGRITEIYLMNQVVETTHKLSELEQNWGEDQYIQCHNSYLINMRRIVVYKRDVVEMKNGFTIPISRKFQKKVKEKFLEWSKKQLF